VAEGQQARRDFEAHHLEEERRKEAERARRYSEWLASIRLPEYLKAMDPRKFEELVCLLFERMGYEVTPTRYVGDGGVDAFVRRGETLSILQCKRVKGSVGEPILRDLFGTMHSEKAGSAFVITTGKVSEQARAWANNKPISLIEIGQLQELILQHFSESDVVPANFHPTATQDRVCPLCGSLLRVVKVRRGVDVGCESYPKCRYTRSRRG